MRSLSFFSKIMFLLSGIGLVATAWMEYVCEDAYFTRLVSNVTTFAVGMLYLILMLL